MISNAKLKVLMTVILILFAVVPAIIVGAVGTFAIVGFESNAKTDTLSTVSLSKSSAFELLFEDYTSTVTSLAKMDIIIDTASQGGNGADSLLDTYVDADKDIIDLLIVDDKGTVVASASGKNTGNFEHFDAENMPLVSTLMTWENYGTDAFFVSKEIYEDPDNKTGSKLGYVCAVIGVGPDSGLVRAMQGAYLDGKAHMILVDYDHNVINYDGTGTVMKAAQLDTAFADKLYQMFENTSYVASGNSQNTMTEGKAGKYTFARGVISDINNWRWAGIVESSYLGSLSLTTNLLGWAVIIVVCAMCSLLGMLIVTKFVKSIRDMLKTMDEIAMADGRSETRFTVRTRKSELGEIMASFNELLDEMQLSEERHRTIAELSDNMLFEWDFQKERMYISDNIRAKFDIDTSVATLSNGRFLDSLMEPEDAEKYKRDINTLLKNKNGYSSEYQLKTKSGAVIWVSLRAVCITDRLGETLRVIGVMTDIDNDKKMELQLSERASYDFLSQLYNRNTFVRTLGSEIERRGANKVATMFIDVDDFKFINDRYGHTVGDEVIKYVADIIRVKVEDKGGFAGRFGGDEFVLCFIDQDDIENIENIAMDIINELYNGYTTADGSIINVKASIGIAYCPEHTEDVNELLSFSDTAMYFVKKNGKTNYHVYLPEDSESGEYVDPEFV